MASSSPLRVALAMGGGTSQGTFSGAALTEALKLLVLYGPEGKTRSIRIDAVSGASAGSVALAVLIRSLLRERTQKEKDELAERLGALYKDDFRRIGHGQPAWEDLVALQAAQEEQERVWTRLVHLGALVGDPDEKRTDPEILRRSAVDDIARGTLTAPSAAEFSARRILGERVLYACTLANLTPLVARGRITADPRETGLIGIEDATTSLVHRDIRVFDLRFAPAAGRGERENPARWCRYHAFGEISGFVGDLRSPATWARIAATAIASGAFPFGFAPVVLTRRRREFGDLWPSQLGGGPETEHAFTYVDGGTFNNEPLREAFRLASHLDALEPEAVERYVLFVDPNVSRSRPPSLEVGIHRETGPREPSLSSLARLAPQVGAMFGAIRNEAAVREADKAAQTRNMFDLRNRQREVIYETIGTRTSPGPVPDRGPAFQQLFDICDKRMLAKDRTDASLPPGTLTLAEEMARVVKEEVTRVPELAVLHGRRLEPAEAFLAAAHPWADPHAGLWLYVLNCVALDLLLGLEGKHQGSRVVGIAPCRHPENPHDPGHFDLPGEAVGTFAGFMSRVAQCQMLEMGRYCAWQFLRTYGVIAPPPTASAPAWPDLTAGEEKRFRQEVEAGLKLLRRRIITMLDDVIDIPLLPDKFVIDKLIGNRIVDSMLEGFDARDTTTTRYPWLVRVPTEKCEMKPLADGIKVHVAGTGPWYRFTLVDYVSPKHDLHKPGQWKLLASAGATLKWKHRGKQKGCVLPPPPAELVKAAGRMASPRFSVEVRIDDSGTIDPGRWVLSPDVRPLEQELLAKPGRPLDPLKPACERDA